MTKVSSIKYQVSGRVIHGMGFGKKLGYPTANIDRRDYVKQKLKMKLGIWAGSAVFSLKSIDSKLKSYKAAIVVGPVDSKGLPKIEAHLIDFKGNLYGKKLVINFSRYIRPFKKFKTIELLKIQIAKDIKKII